jgi:hypothetical protein
MREYPEIRGALQKDEARLHHMAKGIVNSEEDTRLVMRLRDAQAEDLVNFFETVRTHPICIRMSS